MYDLVWFTKVYANVFPSKVSNGLFGYMWSCMALRSYAQFLSLFSFIDPPKLCQCILCCSKQSKHTRKQQALALQLSK